MPRAKQSNALLGHLRPGAAEETADDSPAPRSGPRGRNTAARLVWWTGSLVILAGIATGAFLDGGLAAWLEMAPPIEAFEQYDPPQTTTLLDREGRPIMGLMVWRLYFVRDTVVMLSVSLPKNDRDRPAVDARIARFFDSLKLEQ